jgi:conjugal transfer pilus assembly protein TraK
MASGMFVSSVVSAQQEVSPPQIPFLNTTIKSQQRITPEEAQQRRANPSTINQIETDMAAIYEQQQRQSEAQRQAQLAQQGVISQAILTPGQKFLQDAIDSYKPSMKFSTAPKKSIVIPVGQGLLNTISTNFTELRVKTSDRSSIIETDGGYMYISIMSSNPVGLVIYDAGVQESQVSITLVPVDAPPVIADITVNMDSDMLSKSRQYLKELAMQETLQKAKLEQSEQRGKQANEYEQRIVDLLTPVAQGGIPKGFTLTNEIPAYRLQPCRMAIQHKTGQRLIGGSEVIDIVIAKNTTNQIYQVREEMCYSDDAIAVAVSKKAYLRPGDEVELYILRDKKHQDRIDRQNLRPRLTLGE